MKQGKYIVMEIETRKELFKKPTVELKKKRKNKNFNRNKTKKTIKANKTQKH